MADRWRPRGAVRHATGFSIYTRERTDASAGLAEAAQLAKLRALAPPLPAQSGTAACSSYRKSLRTMYARQTPSGPVGSPPLFFAIRRTPLCSRFAGACIGRRRTVRRSAGHQTRRRCDRLRDGQWHEPVAAARGDRLFARVDRTAPVGVRSQTSQPAIPRTGRARPQYRGKFCTRVFEHARQSAIEYRAVPHRGYL